MEPATNQPVFQKDKINSVNNALKVLNKAAEESADEIRGMVSKDYQHLKSVLADVKPEVRNAFQEMRSATTDSISKAREKVVATSRDTAHQVDESAHRNPWAFVGGAAAVSILVGFLFGRGLKR